jgi:hypothetical protein
MLHPASLQLRYRPGGTGKGLYSEDTMQVNAICQPTLPAVHPLRAVQEFNILILNRTFITVADRLNINQ